MKAVTTPDIYKSKELFEKKLLSGFESWCAFF